MSPAAIRSDVVEEIGYDPERDVANTADSVFCSHGAGYTVRWDEVEQHMHLESCLRAEKETAPAQESVPRGPSAPRTGAALDKELQAIYERTYGAVKQNRAFVPRSEREKPVPQPKAKPIPVGPEYLLVDGYNIIFAWDESQSRCRRPSRCGAPASDGSSLQLSGRAPVPRHSGI